MIWERQSKCLPPLLVGFFLRRWPLRLAAFGVCLLAGCASPSFGPVRAEPFVFEKDTLAFANELAWEYHFDTETGQSHHSTRVPPPAYSHRCFVVARAVLQFFTHARFAPELAPPDSQTYRRLIQQVISTSPRRKLASPDKIVIPGYATLRDFSRDYESILKEECGGAWQSYFQRGHWRMLQPFPKSHQQRMAMHLLDSLEIPLPLVVHAVRFPSLAINHALVIYDAIETETEIQFAVYDPNSPKKPARLTFVRAANRFYFPANFYFKGGRTDIYRIYHSWNY